MYSATNMLYKAKSNPVYGKIGNSGRFYYRNVYLQSEHWKNLRQEKLVKNPLCEKCGTHLSLDVHHKRYGELYDILISDLETLCRICHKKEHAKKDKKNRRKYFKFGKNKKKKNNTLLYIQIPKRNVLPTRFRKIIKVFEIYKNGNIYLFTWFLNKIISQAQDDKKIQEDLRRERNFNTYISIHY